MAILPSVPGIKVEVYINKRLAKEYPDDEPDVPSSNEEYILSRTASNYVESVTDQEFDVRFSVRPPYQIDSPTLIFYTYVDGVRVQTASKYIFMDGLDPPLRGKVTGVGSYDEVTNVATRKLFKFSDVIASSDDEKMYNIEGDKKIMSNVGTITVKVYRGDESQYQFRTSKTRDLVSGGASEVHEKSLKGQAKSHSVGLGPAKIVASNFISTFTRRLGSDDYPVAIFHFKYRSKECLKQLHIIERTPEPEIKCRKRSSSPEFKRSPSAKKIKRERSSDDDVLPVEKKPRYQENIMIDLTASDSEDEQKPRLD